MNELLVYILLGAVSVVAALGLLFSRNAIYAALFLVLNFGVAAVFYLLMNAPFLAVIQISVYAGAIMVLFVFVIMLLGAEQLPAADTGVRIKASRFVIIAGVAVLVASVMYALLTQSSGEAATYASDPAAIGVMLYTQYAFPFEAVSVLLLAAMVGAVVLTTRDAK
ncbi:MAG: NADH-quinone oxidoreductase subunit J [Chloroflexi bacterium]|nr:NADH-quinone oxidoreductase subunit J [Chloroflexota bacterium]